MSDIAIIIPARMGSTRISQKSIADIEGKPMVVCTADRVASLQSKARIIVATDSNEIVKLVEKAGYEARLSPVELASGGDRVAYVAKQLKEKVIVNLQGDEPLMEPEVVTAAIETITKRGRQMGSVMTPFASMAEFQSPGNVKVLLDENLDAIYFSRAQIPFRQNTVSDSAFLENPFMGRHLGIYSYQREFLVEFSNWSRCDFEIQESLEQLRAVFRGVKIGMSRIKSEAVSVDLPEDLEKVREIYRKRGIHGKA